MNYLIHNADSVFNAREQEEARSLIEKHMHRILQVISNTSRPYAVDIYFDKEDKARFQVSAIVNLNGDIIYLRERAYDLISSLEFLFDRIKLAVVKKNYRNRKISSLELKEKQLSALVEYVADLKEMKKNKAQDMFNHMLKNLLKEVASYMNRRLKAAELTTAIKRGRFKVQELLDELYLMIYERFEEIATERVDINTWIYQLADELLENLLKEVEFEKSHFKDLDSFVESEYRMLDEAYAFAADEFDSMADYYSADDLIIGDDETSLLDEITLQLNQKEIHLIIEKELAKLPIFKRTILDLYLINQMSVEEIAEMKEMPPLEVDAVIQEVNKDLVRKLSVEI